MNDDAFARRFYADRAELESARDLAPGREAGRGVLRGRALRAAARATTTCPSIEFTDDELAALRTALDPARRPLRLRRAAAARPAAGLVGAAEPAVERGVGSGRRLGHRLGRRARALAAPGEDRDRDLAPQDDRVRVLHDGARRGLDAQGRPLPPRLPQRAVLPDRPLARARRGAGVPALADPRQGLLRDQGRARLRSPRGLRPSRLREPRRLADGRDGRDGEGLHPRADRVAGRARLRPLRRAPPGAQGGRRARPRHDLRDRLRLEPPARRLGAELATQRDGARADGARGARPAERLGAAARAPQRRASRPRGR